MSHGNSRRRFLQTAAIGGALTGFGDLSFLSKLNPVQAEESKLDPNVVRFDPAIEPIVRLIEETPRGQLLEKIAARIRDGLTYKDVLAALLLAGVRNVEPRPDVGHKFHAVLVVNSAHLASISSPEEHRWLPIFWALDQFKESQAADDRERGWTMSPVVESKVPTADRAKQAFIEAMDQWDEAAADVAVAGLARSVNQNEVYELFYRYGARDFRDIGHKAIFVANSRRTLEVIGWQHAEPVLRSLAYALLKHEGGNPSKGDAAPDQPWKWNRQLASQFRTNWETGKLDSVATVDLLETLRQATAQDVCKKVVELLNSGISAQSIWDGLMVGAGELVVRQPGIVALHAVTSSNALRYAFEATGNEDSKRMLLLQNAAFVPLFRDAMKSRGAIQEAKLETFEPANLEHQGPEAVAEIFANVSNDRMLAARKILTYVRENPQPKELIDAARLLVFLKGTNVHDYKFSSAVLEDCQNISPEWRDRYLAASVYNLRGSIGPDNQLVKRIRSAFA